jgi:serine/threonine protein phosphatase 1
VIVLKYVTSDIHGNNNKFFELLELINFTKDDELYILGDIIDGYSGFAEILNFIIKSNNIFCIEGNHEQMMTQTLKNNNDKIRELWFQNNGCDTLNLLEHFSLEKQNEYKDYIFNLKNHILLDDHFILVHAGIQVPRMQIMKQDAAKILNSQDETFEVWARKEFFSNRALKGYKVIFGHTPTFMISTDLKQPFPEKQSIWYDNRFKDKICVDCGILFPYLGGRLGCLRLDDMKEFYS